MAIFNLRWPGKKQQDADNQRVIRAPRSNPAESADAMRRRARHRLIGATVLVLLAIIGFPMLFDTQPRPLPVNASIEIPDREKVAALSVPPAASVGPVRADNGLVAGEEIVSGGNSGRHASGTAQNAATAAAAASAAAAAAASARPADKPAVTKPETKPEPKPEPKPKDEPKPTPKPETKPEPKPEAKPQSKPEAKPEAKPKEEPKKEEKPKEQPKPKRDDEADRVRAMMEGRQAAASAAKPEAAAAASSRYIIQVGAFA